MYSKKPRADEDGDQHVAPETGVEQSESGENQEEVQEHATADGLVPALELKELFLREVEDTPDQREDGEEDDASSVEPDAEDEGEEDDDGVIGAEVGEVVLDAPCGFAEGLGAAEEDCGSDQLPPWPARGGSGCEHFLLKKEFRE